MAFLLINVVNSELFSQGKLSKITPDLQSVLISSSDKEFIDAYVKLKDKYPVGNLTKQSTFLNKKEKRKLLVKNLKEFTAEKQKNVMTFLKDAQKKGKVKKLEVLWTLNYIVFSATAEVINAVANNFDEIAEIRYDPHYSPESLLDADDRISQHTPLNTDEIQDINPGITLMNADDVWAQGYTGQGVLVASIDEGCGWTCPDLVNRLWQNLGEDYDEDGQVIGNE